MVEKLEEDFIREEEVNAEEETETEDNSRWTYFVVSKVDHEFSTKMEVKKWLQENGSANTVIIRGRYLTVSERVKRIVSIN